MKTIIDPALIKTEMENDSHVVETVKKTMINAMRMCVVEAKDGLIWSATMLTIRSVIENVLDEELVAGKVQRVVVKLFVPLSVVEAVSDALLRMTI